MNKPYPERCLRGLREEESIHRNENGLVEFVTEHAFRPPTKKSNLEDRVNRRHKSNHYESSINWEDHMGKSFQVLCEDQKNSKCGVVSICLADLKKAKQDNPMAAKYFDWERDEIKGNPFHGNLLFSAELPPPLVRMLAAVIASHVQPNLIFIEPENYQSELANRATMPKHISFLKRLFIRVRTAFGISAD